MKILLTSFGTRGDIQPYLALAVGFQRAGHQATLATSYNYTEWIEAYGIQTCPTPFNLQEFSRQPENQAILKSGNFFRQMGLLREAMRRNAEAQTQVWAAIQEADLVIQSPAASGALEARHLRGIPAVFAVPVPFASTRAFPSFFFGMSRASLSVGYNRFTHWLMHQLLWNMMGGPTMNPLRQKLGLRPLASFGNLIKESAQVNVPWLYGFSSHVIAKPTDWDEHQHITGYWFLEPPPTWQPAPELQQFLEAGPPPIYIGFGSMNHEDPERQSRLALRALELSGQRGILLTGWGGLARQTTSANVLVIEDVPHNWLFPRVAAVVHHGGAGTTGAVLQAGVPNLITPFAPNDQIAWADLTVKLGVGPRLPNIKLLSAEKLAEAIQSAITNPSLRARAAALGEKIRAENGVARAVEIIEQHTTQFHQAPSRKVGPNIL